MTLSATWLQAQLAPRPVKFFEQVGSTQNVAMEWLRAGAMTGAVVIGDAQTTGRGRYGRTWSTPAGTALAVSLLLRPTQDALPHVMMLGAVATAGLIESLGAANVTLKWPNDVLISGRKVGGILPEAAWDGDHLCGVALGIGINIRNDFTNTELAHTAVSLESVLKRTLHRGQLVVALLAQIDLWMPHLGTPALFDTWKARLCTLGQHVTVTQPGQTLHGCAESVDAQGALWVRAEDDTLHRVIAGDVSGRIG